MMPMRRGDPVFFLAMEWLSGSLSLFHLSKLSFFAFVSSPTIFESTLTFLVSIFFNKVYLKKKFSFIPLPFQIFFLVFLSSPPLQASFFIIYSIGSFFLSSYRTILFSPPSFSKKCSSVWDAIILIVRPSMCV